MLFAQKNPKSFKVAMSAHMIKDWDAALNTMFYAAPETSKIEFCDLEIFENSIRDIRNDIRNYDSAPMRFNLFQKKLICSQNLRLSVLETPEVSEAKKNDILSLMEYLQEDANMECYQIVLGNCNSHN